MQNGHDKADEATLGVPARLDSGATFIEVLVALVLLGTVVVAVLTALTSSIRGSVTQEEQVKALAVLEAASSGLKERGDCADYEARARAAVNDAAWAARLTATADCASDPDFDRVVLEVVAPRGLEEQLTILVGGPRVADTTTTDDEIDELVVVPCAVTSLSVTPTTVVLDEITDRTDVGALSEDIEVIATTDAECTGGFLRARLTPPPEDDDGAEIQPAFVERAPNEYVLDELKLGAGVLVWRTGSYDLDVQFVRSDDGALVAAGGRVGLFELTCRVEATATPDDPVRSGTGQLQNDVALEVDVSDACATPTAVTFEVDVSAGGVAAGSLTLVGDVWEGAIPGEGAGGPTFDADTTEIRILDQAGEVLQTIELEVQA